MDVYIETNLNCAGSEQFVFHPLGPARVIRGIRVNRSGQDVDCDVTGVETGGQFVPAYARKIADSGAGYAYLIYGAQWGIRLRPAAFGSEVWDLANKRQWGEPFKIYGEESDILYGKV